jgi:hypothetical protein
MPQPKPFRNSHAPAQPSEETEFPRFKKPVGALAESASQEEKPVTVQAAGARRRSARFLLGFMAGVLAAGIGVAVVFLMLIRGDLDSINPAQQPPNRHRLPLRRHSIRRACSSTIPTPRRRRPWRPISPGGCAAAG